MSAGFRAFCYNCVRAAPDKPLCKKYGCRYGNYRYAGFLPHIYIASGISCPCSQYLYFFLRRQFCKFWRMGVHKHKVYAKGLVRKGSANVYLFLKPCRIHTAGGYDSQSSGIGTCRRKPPCGDICHTSLYHGIFCFDDLIKIFQFPIPPVTFLKRR